MSGGSFNYLYCQQPYSFSDLEAMADELESRGMPDAAEHTRQFMRKAPMHLTDLWHAIEWHVSCDYSEEQATEAYERYRAVEVMS